MTDAKPQAANDNLTPRKMLGLKQVLAIVPLSRATLYREMDAGRFPKAREIAPRRVAWYEDDIEAWQAALDQRAA
ncbi:AlpA family phage regulatory protein [Bradyrhizobium sp. S3.5.5]|uniref:helix-turn-helix transcriptional regulator n=1 Tax=Bradyrhizobium sp. S3.5.5 TaxID=3156430 RepID=UPI0033915F0B